jgi:hypothetical protein
MGAAVHGHYPQRQQQPQPQQQLQLHHQPLYDFAPAEATSHRIGGFGGQSASASASLEGFLQEDGEEKGGGPYSSQLIGKNGSMNRNGNYAAGGSVKHQEQELPQNGGASYSDEDSDSNSDREGNSNHNLSSAKKVSSLANRVGGKTGLKTTKLVKKKSPA